MLADAELAGRIDLPGQLDPEFVLFPDAARIGFVRVLHFLAGPLRATRWHRLPKGDPRAAVRLVAIEVVPLGAVPHRQHEIGKVGRLVPRRRQRDVQADFRFVATAPRSN